MILLYTILYGVLAGASALAAAAVVVVLRSGHSRRNGIIFAVGFLATQLLVILLALALGLDSLPKTGAAHAAAQAVVSILLGCALLVAAREVRRPHPQPVVSHAGPLAQELRARQTAMLNRISALGPGALFGAGAVLVIGPKRLVLTLLAAGAIGASTTSGTGEVSLVMVFVALATVLVWVPVVLAVVWGSRAGEWTAMAQSWWKNHRAVATFVPLLGFGVYFVVAGVVHLFSI